MKLAEKISQRYNPLCLRDPECATLVSRIEDAAKRVDADPEMDGGAFAEMVVLSAMFRRKARPYFLGRNR